MVWFLEGKKQKWKAFQIFLIETKETYLIDELLLASLVCPSSVFNANGEYKYFINYKTFSVFLFLGFSIAFLFLVFLPLETFIFQELCLVLSLFFQIFLFILFFLFSIYFSFLNFSIFMSWFKFWVVLSYLKC